MRGDSELLPNTACSKKKSSLILLIHFVPPLKIWIVIALAHSYLYNRNVKQNPETLFPLPYQNL